jgi:HSP20 family protein
MRAIQQTNESPRGSGSGIQSTARPRLEVVRSPAEWDPLSELRAIEPMGFFPPVDVKETDDAIELVIDLPGMSEGDVQVDVAGDRVVLRGERRDDPQQSGRYHMRERPRGPFQRVIALPPGVDVQRATAALINGVLQIAVPKTAEYRTRSIPVEERGRSLPKSPTSG